MLKLIEALTGDGGYDNQRDL